MGINGTTMEELVTMRAIQNINRNIASIEKRIPSLRDQFAMVALTGLCARDLSFCTEDDRAELAYGLADAMLKARDNVKDNDEGLQG